jgi:hypothetical protein
MVSLRYKTQIPYSLRSASSDWAENRVSERRVPNVGSNQVVQGCSQESAPPLSPTGTLSLFLSELNALPAEPRIFADCITYGAAHLLISRGLVGNFCDLVEQRHAKDCGRGSMRQDQKST